MVSRMANIANSHVIANQPNHHFVYIYRVLYKSRPMVVCSPRLPPHIPPRSPDIAPYFLSVLPVDAKNEHNGSEWRHVYVLGCTRHTFRSHWHLLYMVEFSCSTTCEKVAQVFVSKMQPFLLGRISCVWGQCHTHIWAAQWIRAKPPNPTIFGTIHQASQTDMEHAWRSLFWCYKLTNVATNSHQLQYFARD